MNANWLKWAGILDGALIAALTYVGQTNPAITWAIPLAQGLGVLGTILGITHSQASKQLQG
jgi:hypothetical protein